MISVIMPVKNGAETIEKAIQSILNQSFQDFEIIVIDDHSDDRTLDIVNNFVKNDERIKIIKNEKSLGVGTSLNLGLRHAKYEFVARMDADDEAMKDRLKLQFDYLQQHPNVAVIGGQVLLMGPTSQHDCLLQYETSPEIIKNKLLKYSVLSHPTVMYRKSVILEVGGYRDFFKNAEDYDLWLRLIRKGYHIANLKEAVLRYRVSISGATVANRWMQYIYHRLAQHAFYFPEDKLDETLYKKIEAQYANFRLRYIVATYSLTMDWLLRSRQFKKAWPLFKAIPNKFALYSMKKVLFAFIYGLFRMNKGWYVSEFYDPYLPG